MIAGSALKPLHWNLQVCSATQLVSLQSVRRSRVFSRDGCHLRRAAGDATGAQRNRSWSLRSLLFGVLALCIGCGQRVLAAQPAPPAPTSRLMRFIVDGFELLEQSRRFGKALLVVAFSFWVACSMPTTIVELAAAYIYGAQWGFIASMSSKTLGSVFAFMIVRLVQARRRSSLIREWKFPEVLQPRLDALKSKPLLSMVSIRLAPVPLGLKNYGLALCGVGFIPYMLAGIIVNLPFSLLWAITGSSCYSLQEAMSVGTSLSMWPKLIASIAGVSVALFACFFLLSTRDSQTK